MYYFRKCVLSPQKPVEKGTLEFAHEMMLV